MNRVPDNHAGSRSNTGSSKTQCPAGILQSPYSVPINPGFLNTCNKLPYCKCSAQDCQFSLDMLQINLNKFTIWDVLCLFILMLNFQPPLVCCKYSIRSQGLCPAEQNNSASRLLIGTLFRVFLLSVPRAMGK
jgi:hypothetical protein